MNQNISNEPSMYLCPYPVNGECGFKEDPSWQCFRVVLSGPETPGEGEHKIMDYIRKAKVWQRFDLDLLNFVVKYLGSFG